MPPGERLAHFTSTTVSSYNGEFFNDRNQKIHCYYWKPLVNPRALLLISHGFTEHCMMYDALANEMARRGFFVFAHDHSGHGHSQGARAFMYSMRDLVEDSEIHIQLVREEYPDPPLFICGHSMGGAISLLISWKKEFDVRGVVLIAPALAPNPETATFFKVTLAKLLSKFVPYFPISNTDYSISCQNKSKVEEMNKDKLRFHGYWKARPAVCLIQTAEEIMSKSTQVNVPFLLLHGDNDKVCHFSGSTKLYEEASSEDKTMKIYPGAYHSLLNEPQEIADDVFERTVQWLDSRG